jgi:hypothetical protein
MSVCPDTAAASRPTTLLLLLLLHLEVAEAQTVLVETVQGPFASHEHSELS